MFGPKRNQCSKCRSDYNKELKKRSKDYDDSCRYHSKYWALNNPERKRAGHVKQTYGLEWGELVSKYESQNGCCEICKKPVSLYKGYSDAKTAHVDHNHITGEVRGLLCSRCNTIIGVLEANQDLAFLMVEYLDRYKEKELGDNED
jgi:hypothetical protein